MARSETCAPASDFPPSSPERGVKFRQERWDGTSRGGSRRLSKIGLANAAESVCKSTSPRLPLSPTRDLPRHGEARLPHRDSSAGEGRRTAPLRVEPRQLARRRRGEGFRGERTESEKTGGKAALPPRTGQGKPEGVSSRVPSPWKLFASRERTGQERQWQGGGRLNERRQRR